jgi:hypothetical protein
MTEPQIAGETTMSRAGQPAAASSSPTIDSSSRPMPPPPYSSGMLTPMKPPRATADHSSLMPLFALDFST